MEVTTGQPAPTGRQRDTLRTTRSLRATSPVPVLLSLLVVLSCSGMVGAQDLVNEVKAEFIERFARLIEWPESSGVNDGTAPFVIGVTTGDSGLRNALENLTRRTRIKGKAAEIQEVSNSQAAVRCQILVIGTDKRGEVDTFVAQVRGRPILTIGNAKGLARRGVMISFISEGNFVRFEINPGAASRAGLTIADSLLALGEVVE